jgi:hypothetical protein
MKDALEFLGIMALCLFACVGAAIMYCIAVALWVAPVALTLGCVYVFMRACGWAG